MDQRPIPNTDLSVSTVCLGTMTFGIPVGEAEAITLTHAALDLGINFIDTANMYEGYTRHMGSPGEKAEAFLGKALAGRRDDAILATKVGNQVGPEPEDDGTSPAAIRKQLDLSLNRLATDFVDIYYLHKPDAHGTPLPEILGTLNDAIAAGKIRYYGISNYSAQETADLLKAADANGLPRPIIHQPPYSLLKPDAAEDLLPLCAKEGIAAAPYQILQGGLLTGKYKRGQEPPADSRKAESSWIGDLDEAMFSKLEALETEAQTKGMSLLRYTLRSTLALPAVVSVVLGAKRPDQVAGLVAAVG